MEMAGDVVSVLQNLWKGNFAGTAFKMLGAAGVKFTSIGELV